MARKGIECPVVGCEGVGIPQKTPSGAAQSHHAELTVVHLESRSNPQIHPLLGEHLHRDLIENHSIGLPQALQRPLQHTLRMPSQRRSVEADELQAQCRTVLQLRLHNSPVERHRPCDAGHASHSLHLDVSHGNDLVRLSSVLVHDPNLGTNRSDRRCRQKHEATESSKLLDNEKCGKGQPSYEGKIFHPIPEQHQKGHHQQPGERGGGMSPGDRWRSIHLVFVSI